VRRLATVGVLGAVVAALAGCGGSTELSDKQLRLHATRVCSIANRQSGRIKTPSQPSGGATFLDRGIAVLAPEYRQLRALRPPGDLAQVYNISLSALSGKLTAMKSAVKHLKHGGDPVIAMKTLQQQLGPLESSEDGAWQALEVPACLNR
jgi:hypothetical protein